MSVIDWTTRGPSGASGSLDLEGQTTPVFGDDLPARVVLDQVYGNPGLVIAFESETAPDVVIWRGVRNEAFNVSKVGGLGSVPVHNAWRRLRRLGGIGTPVDDEARELAWYSATSSLFFRTTLDHWQHLVASANLGPDVGRPGESSSSEAWRTFEELGVWLRLSHAETAKLLGLGAKTAYGWRRAGSEPQPRLARRLYQTHALVRQLVLSLGEADARARIRHGGVDSALSLIEQGRVADAEARFAELIYDRRPAAEGVSRSGDNDIPVEAPFVGRLAGGRRRVKIRRGRQ